MSLQQPAPTLVLLLQALLSITAHMQVYSLKFNKYFLMCCTTYCVALWDTLGSEYRFKAMLGEVCIQCGLSVVCAVVESN